MFLSIANPNPHRLHHNYNDAIAFFLLFTAIINQITTSTFSLRLFYCKFSSRFNSKNQPTASVLLISEMPDPLTVSNKIFIVAFCNTGVSCAKINRLISSRMEGKKGPNDKGLSKSIKAVIYSLRRTLSFSSVSELIFSMSWLTVSQARASSMPQSAWINVLKPKRN